MSQLELAVVNPWSWRSLVGWPVRWQHHVGQQDLDLLPWRQARQWRDWLWATGALGLGLFVGGWLVWVWRQPLELQQRQEQQRQTQITQALSESRQALADWQRRWAWQAQQVGLTHWRQQAWRGLLQALSAPMGLAHVQSLGWDGRQATVSLLTVHPQQAQAWLEHWQPHAGGQWQRQGGWNQTWLAMGQSKGLGAHVWRSQWQWQIVPTANNPTLRP